MTLVLVLPILISSLFASDRLYVVYWVIIVLFFPFFYLACLFSSPLVLVGVLLPARVLTNWI